MVKVRSNIFSIVFQIFSSILIIGLLITTIGSVVIPCEWKESVIVCETPQEVKQSKGYAYAVDAIGFIEREENVKIEKIEKISYLQFFLYTYMALNVSLDDEKSESFYIKFQDGWVYDKYTHSTILKKGAPTMIERIDFDEVAAPFLLEKNVVYTYDEYSLSIIAEATIGGNAQ